MGEIEASPSTRLPPAADHLLAQRPGEGIHNAPSPPHAVPPGLEPSVARERKVQLETSGEVTSGHIHSAWSMQDSRGLISNPPGMVQETAKEELIMSEIYEVLLYHGALTGQGAHPGPVLESLLVGASDLEVSRVRYTTLLKKLIAEGYATADGEYSTHAHSTAGAAGRPNLQPPVCRLVDPCHAPTASADGGGDPRRPTSTRRTCLHLRGGGASAAEPASQRVIPICPAGHEARTVTRAGGGVRARENMRVTYTHVSGARGGSLSRCDPGL